MSIVYTYTDFGAHGPYLAQMHTALLLGGVDSPVLHLLNDAPACNPYASAYLLAALFTHIPQGSVLLGVVDPGVGSPYRRPLCMQVGGRWLVGPDNGLFSRVAASTPDVRAFEILWRPERLSRSFHGRDLFAPVVAMLAKGVIPNVREIDEWVGREWSDEVAEVIYLDHYGNAFTGLKAAAHPKQGLAIAGQCIMRAETFSDTPVGTPLCYGNACGLLEIAVNQGRADTQLGVSIGTSVTLLD